MTITYDSVNILTDPYVPRFIKHESSPERLISLLDNANDDGSILISEKYGVKHILLQGIIYGSSASDLETKIDVFKEVFSREAKNLDISWEAGTRRYVATCTSHKFDRDSFNISMCPWSADFIIPGGIGENISEVSSVVEDTFGSGLWNENVTFLGSAKPKPRLVIKPTVLATGKYRNISIEVDNKRIVIPFNSALAADTELEVSCRDKTIEYDSAEMDEFYGQFPDFILGSNAIEVKIGDILDEKQEEYNGIVTIHATTDVAINTNVAQSIKVRNTDYSYAQLGLRLKKVGSPTGNLLIKIKTDSGGDPDTTVSTYDGIGNTTAEFTVDVSTLTTSFAWVKKMTDDGANRSFKLDADTVYWIEIDASAIGDVDNYVQVQYDGIYKDYNKGHMALYYKTGAVWAWHHTDLDGDISFRLYFGNTAYGDDSKGSVYYYKRYL